MMSVIVQRKCRGVRSRARPRPRFDPRLVVFAVSVMVLLGICPTRALSEEVGIATGLGIRISRVVKVRLASPFEPNPRPVTDADATAAAEAAPVVDVAEVSVTTNTADWGVVVRFMLPDEGKLKFRDAAARCRLVEPDGKVISEQFIEDGEVFLEGNGRRGCHTLFLEVDGFFKAFGVETLTEPMVDVAGWSASEEM